MRPTFALVFAAAVLAGAAVAGQQTTFPPIVKPPSLPAPTTTPIPGTYSSVPPRPDAAAIVGQVVDNSGRGVPRAAVRLIGDSVLQTVLTDARGRFFFRNLPRGEVIVTAQKSGFFDGAYGKRRSTGQPLPFSVYFGQIMSDMRIEMFGAGVITGFVVDEVGEPIIGTRVVARRRQFVAGAWQYVESGREETDDEGMYRIFGLQPGEYIVSTAATSFSMPTSVIDGGPPGGGVAKVLTGIPGDTGEARARFLDTRAGTTSDGRNIVWTTGAALPDDDGRGGVYPAQFYASTDQRMLALPVTLGSSEVRYAVNFQLPLVPSRLVTGRLVGKSATNQIVRLVPFGADAATGDDTAITTSDRNGNFAFHPVPAGRYTLHAGAWETVIQSRTESPDQILIAIDGRLGTGEPWARTDVIVSDADVDVPDLEMQATTAIMGMIVADGEAGGRIGSRISITPAAPGLSRPANLRLTSAGQFVAANIVPGEYYLRVDGLSPGWFLRSVSSNDRDILDEPIRVGESGASVTVTMTRRGTEIIGSVLDSRMQKASGAAVIILPVDARGDTTRTLNRARETRASANGVFIVNGLPPGDYLIVAIDDALAEGWQDPRALATLRTLATRISLRDQESKTLQLRLSIPKK